MTKAMKCATEVAKYLGDHGLYQDVSIYVDHKRYDISEDGKLAYDIDAEPKQYFDWAGDFMSMSFEGPLYDVFNYSFEFRCYEKNQEDLDKIFKKYDHYAELGNSWNLSLYKL